MWAAYSHMMTAAQLLGRRDDVREGVRTLVASNGLMAQVLGRELGLAEKAKT